MRIQIVVDDSLGNELQSKAHDLGFSTSSYVRYLIKVALDNKHVSEIDLALNDIANGNVEKISLHDFKKQLKDLDHYAIKPEKLRFPLLP